MELKEVRKKIIITSIAFLIFVLFCIISVIYAKINTEKIKNPVDISETELYDN